jgi:hypothetical protein
MAKRVTDDYERRIGIILQAQKDFESEQDRKARLEAAERQIDEMKLPKSLITKARQEAREVFPLIVRTQPELYQLLRGKGIISQEDAFVGLLEAEIRKRTR